MVNWTAVQDLPASVTLSNLDSLNEHGNTSVFLTSKEGIDADPQPGWLYGDTFDQNNNTGDAISSVVITRDHRNGTLDAFYFYFYAWVIQIKKCIRSQLTSPGTTRETQFWEWSLVTT